MQHLSRLSVILILAMSATLAAADDCRPRQFLFSWNLAEACPPQPRVGTSRGAPVALATEPSPQWRALREPGLSAFERDRRAILAMAGGYRASFEFLESVAYAADYEPAAPYQSWGTEYIYVVADRGDFISLQHVMVMVIEQQDGTLSEPMVMKHWRQDWQYQDPEILEYAGNGRWQTRRFDEGAVQGTWSQSVYQVDDSPRYASVGSWWHNDSFSAWQSGNTWRPLPRREHTVRDDYQVLEGMNRHVILPTGWVQEEENLKRRLTTTAAPYVAKELGNNRYQRIEGFDWSAGDAYWKETGPFWAVVRRQWAALIERHRHFSLKEGHDGIPLFAALFQLAEEYRAGELERPEAAVATLLDRHLQEDQPTRH